MLRFYQTSKITLLGIHSLSQHINNRQTRLSALHQICKVLSFVTIFTAHKVVPVSVYYLSVYIFITRNCGSLPSSLDANEFSTEDNIQLGVKLKGAYPCKTLIVSVNILPIQTNIQKEQLS